MIRTIVVDDEPLIRGFLCSTLAIATDVTVVAECGDGDEAVEAIRAHAPDVVFLDVQMPGCDGFGVIEVGRAVEDAPGRLRHGVRRVRHPGVRGPRR